MGFDLSEYFTEEETRKLNRAESLIHQAQQSLKDHDHTEGCACRLCEAARLVLQAIEVL